jgi:predicted MPP superfamily phosphohydrolase
LRLLAEGILSAVLTAGIAARWSYALGLHGRLHVTHHEVSLGGRHALPEPLVIAFASDFHAGPSTHPQMYVRLAEEISRLRPHVLLLGGDYVSTDAEHVDVLRDILSDCAPPLGKYAVLGNHDLWSGHQHIVKQLVSAGVQVLVNRNVALPPPFEHVSICGIDDPWMGSVDVARAFEGAGPVRIFLTHSPDGLQRARGTRFDLGLAGHTHGGQIAYPDGSPIVSPGGGELSWRYSRGRFEVEGSGPLIVSRGVGCGIVPIRINSDPELVVCTLRGDSGA